MPDLIEQSDKGTTYKKYQEWQLPVDMHPFVVSPSAWTWKPWGPGARPETFPVTVVGPEEQKNKI